MEKKKVTEKDFIKEGMSRKYVPWLVKQYRDNIGKKFIFIKDYPYSNFLGLTEEKMKEKAPHLLHFPKKGEVWELVMYDIFFGFAGCFGGDTYIEDSVFIKGSKEQQKFDPIEISVSIFYEITEPID